MNRDNKTIIVSGLSAAILDAEMHVKKRPGSKGIPAVFFPTINWEDASEEMRNDPKVCWFTAKPTLMHKGGKYTFRNLTKEEKDEIQLDKEYKLKETFNFILKNYGWEYAEAYYTKARKSEFKKYNVKINLNEIPHCKYTKGNQCDLFCPFYAGRCLYKENEVE